MIKTKRQKKIFNLGYAYDSAPVISWQESKRLDNQAGDFLVDFSLADIAHVMNLFANDMLFVHHHAIGSHFDAIHNITMDLYEKAKDDVDTIAEMAMRMGEDLENFSLSKELITDDVYSIVNLNSCEEVDKETMEDIINSQGRAMLDCLRSYCVDYPKDIASVLDDIANWWEQEINYKNRARMK